MPVNQIFDPFAMQMQSPTMMMSNEMSPNEPQFWDIGVDNLVGGFNNHPYNNITSLPTTASSASTTALSTTTVVTSAADYFPSTTTTTTTIITPFHYANSDVSNPINQVSFKITSNVS